MSAENPLWGSPRIQAELERLGYGVSKSTVEKYMIKRGTGGTREGWRTFIRTHLNSTAAVDFFAVPTLTFKLIYGIVVLGHGRRKILHVNVTSNPTEDWTVRQLMEAFPYDSAPRYLVRDRDSRYGYGFRRRMNGLGIEEVVTGYKSPWQNAYCERVIGTLRRDCLDHFLILNEEHLKRILNAYVIYYNHVRPHQSLANDAPCMRPQETADEVVSIPAVYGLHREYHRAA